MAGLKNMSNRERAMVTMAIVVVLIFVGKRFGYQAFEHRIDLMEIEVSAKEKLLQYNRHMLSREKQINEEWEALQRFLPEMNNQNVGVAFQDLVLVARDTSGVQLTRFQMREREDHGFFSEYVLEVSLESGLKEFIHFLYIMEQAGGADSKSGLISIREMDLEPLQPGASEGVKARILFLMMVSATDESEDVVDGEV
jgi:hypothetical protein